MAIKHNNVIPNVHFRKWWQRYVKTWFNQAGRKKTRRVARQQKAAKSFPRPCKKGTLRPVVHPPTVRYNMKLRAGRGFTLDELKKAGISQAKARTIGIAVDHRRRNHCEESLATNVARLEEYLSKLLVFPRKAGAKHLKAGDASKEDLKAAVAKFGQNSCKGVLPVKQESKRTKSRAITADETAAHPKIEGRRAHSAYRILRKAIEDKKNVGRKIRRTRAAEAKKM